jgi:peptidyl-prolyl cis-trans isomerase SurA
MIKYLKIALIIFFLTFSKGLTIENKIILKIDNEIITTLDVYKEITNIKFFNRNLNNLSDEEIYQISIQSLIKYEIKKNEISKKFKIVEIQNKDYLDQLIEKTFKDLGFQNLQNFKNELIKREISFENFEEKLKIEILWNQLIFSTYYNKLVIDEEKLKRQINNIDKTVKSFNLNEIIFNVESTEEIETKYNLILNDIQKLGFEGAALKHSISNSSINGGNLGWIDEKNISKQILEQINKINIKSITKPIRISSGFLILQKFDEREIQKNLDSEEELKKLIDYEKNQQLNNYSNLYYNKIKKNIKINAP